MSHFIVMTATAKMPASCRGRYRRIAVVEVESADTFPKFIGAHARGVVRIVCDYGGRHVGKTERGEYQRFYQTATKLAASLNAASSHKESAQ